MWEVWKMQGAIFNRPTWQGLFLQSHCIYSIHGGQMWEVWRMQGAIFNHGHMHCPTLSSRPTGEILCMVNVRSLSLVEMTA